MLTWPGVNPQTLIALPSFMATGEPARDHDDSAVRDVLLSPCSCFSSLFCLVLSGARCCQLVRQRAGRALKNKALHLCCLLRVARAFPLWRRHCCYCRSPRDLAPPPPLRWRVHKLRAPNAIHHEWSPGEKTRYTTQGDARANASQSLL